MIEVDVSARDLAPFIELIGEPRVEAIARRAAQMRERLGGATVWNVNSTAAGGGVAEMLRSLLRYARGLGIDVRWLVLEGPPEFFAVTKRLHNALHDSIGDGSALGPKAAALYEQVTRANATELDRYVKPGDVLVCHDPQTAGLVPHLLGRGVHVVWRCHIGHERLGKNLELGWTFLRKYLEAVPLAIFTRQSYAPSWLPHKRTVVVPPNIDPFSVKNHWMPELTIRAILSRAGLVEGAGISPEDAEAGALFVREDGSAGHVTRAAHVVQGGAPPSWTTPLVVQVSRWDRMKDPTGVLVAFARLVRQGASKDSELVLAGPSVRGVADDPEGPEVLREVCAIWDKLPDALKLRVHIAELPMADNDENAAMVNALQRHAAVIVQKSVEEGFGLTVTEAMWKRKPIVASAVGGIRDQIRDGVEGVLVHDPRDAEEAAHAIGRVLADDALAARLGEAACARVRESYLSVSSLERWADILAILEERRRSGGR